MVQARKTQEVRSASQPSSTEPASTSTDCWRSRTSGRTSTPSASSAME
jgi:hypothetical protein